MSRVVLDILKPHIPTLVDFCKEISKVKGVKKVNGLVVEVDAETDSIKLTVEGKDIDFEELESTVKKLGAAIHSVDEVLIEG
ncbi:MAG TPA: hypothetical protein ENF33_03710 [Nitrososphaeria archaeon]|nr:MAG: hypothetical protein DRN68_01055 [Nitrososphaerota archaeon]HDJ66795.1 hypothetical protein [Nitrososphaeria archaeon]